MKKLRLVEPLDCEFDRSSYNATGPLTRTFNTLINSKTSSSFSRRGYYAKTIFMQFLYDLSLINIIALMRDRHMAMNKPADYMVSSARPFRHVWRNFRKVSVTNDWSLCTTIFFLQLALRPVLIAYMSVYPFWLAAHYATNPEDNDWPWFIDIMSYIPQLNSIVNFRTQHPDMFESYFHDEREALNIQGVAEMNIQIFQAINLECFRWFLQFLYFRLFCASQLLYCLYIMQSGLLWNWKGRLNFNENWNMKKMLKSWTAEFSSFYGCFF